jgi:hypothetical protein
MSQPALSVSKPRSCRAKLSPARILLVSPRASIRRRTCARRAKQVSLSAYKSTVISRVSRLAESSHP